MSFLASILLSLCCDYDISANVEELQYYGLQKHEKQQKSETVAVAVNLDDLQRYADHFSLKLLN